MNEINDYKVRARRLFDSLALIVSEESAAVSILALAEVTARILVKCPIAESITKAFCDDLMRNVKEDLKKKKNDTELH